MYGCCGSPLDCWMNKIADLWPLCCQLLICCNTVLQQLNLFPGMCPFYGIILKYFFCLFLLQFEIKLLNHFVLFQFILNAYYYHVTFNYHIILNNFCFHFLLSCLKIFLCLFFQFKFYFPLIVLFTSFSLMLFFLFNSFTLLCCDFLFYCFSLSLFSFL